MARPTSERVREAVFDVLGRRVQESTVLDLCAGTGTFGFEALSRGASKVSFVEKNRVSAQIIEKNAGALGVAELVSVKVCEAIQAINFFDRAKETFTIIFVDPPYDTNETERIWHEPALRRVISDSGVLVMESRYPRSDRRQPDLLKRCFARRYGDTLVEMFSLEEEE